jgi:hypothetical protein
MMTFGAALVCIAVLCGIDALMFDGRYAAAATSVIAAANAKGAIAERTTTVTNRFIDDELSL